MRHNTIVLIEFIDRSSSRSSGSFVFEATELVAYLTATVSAWDAMPRSHSPHKQVVRDHQAYIAPLRSALDTLQAALSVSPDIPLTWDNLFAPYDTYLVVNLVEAGYGLVACPYCHGVYTAMELTVYDFSHSNIAGRQIRCPKNCLLDEVIERMGPIGEEPPFPTIRTVRRAAQRRDDLVL